MKSQNLTYNQTRIFVDSVNWNYGNLETNTSCLTPNLEVLCALSALSSITFNKYTNYFQQNIGDKNYELKNHLGNVLAVVSDRKLVKPYVGGNFDGFESDVVSYSNYYPFGMEIKALSLNGESTRYGFGGHEKDNEISGNGNYLAFGDYGYNPRLARRFNIDPMIGTFPWMSPYAVFNNNPIYFADPTGLSPEGGPEDREINQGINSDDKFKGHKSLAEKKGTTSNGNVVFADVSKGARLGPFANASRIATANGLTTDQLYALNPGLKENKNNIGQQLIYVSGPNAPIITPEESKDGVSIADKSPSAPNGWENYKGFWLNDKDLEGKEVQVNEKNSVGSNNGGGFAGRGDIEVGRGPGGSISAPSFLSAAQDYFFPRKQSTTYEKYSYDSILDFENKPIYGIGKETKLTQWRSSDGNTKTIHKIWYINGDTIKTSTPKKAGLKMVRH